MPQINAIVLREGDIEQDVPHKHFSSKWYDFKLRHTMDVKNASNIFKNIPNRKCTYIALTFWIRSQLDLFPGDSFRTAWSGFNTLYTFTAPANARREFQKIEAFWAILDPAKFTRSLTFVNQLNKEGIWISLDWESYIPKKVNTFDEFLQIYHDDAYTSMACEVYCKKTFSPVEDIRAKYEIYINSTETSPFIQLRFLVSGYSYFHRNRCVHGEREYPVFVISHAEEIYTEEKLCELLLFVIEDAIKLIPLEMELLPTKEDDNSIEE